MAIQQNQHSRMPTFATKSLSIGAKMDKRRKPIPLLSAPFARAVMIYRGLVSTFQMPLFLFKFPGETKSLCLQCTGNLNSFVIMTRIPSLTPGESLSRPSHGDRDSEPALRLAGFPPARGGRPSYMTAHGLTTDFKLFNLN